MRHEGLSATGVFVRLALNVSAVVMPRLSPLSSQGGKNVHARWRRYLVKPLKWNEIPAAHIPPDVLNREINFLQRKSDQNTASE